MTGFDHTGWTHTSFSPYEPDTDGTEVQVEPLPADAGLDLAGITTAGTHLMPWFGAEDDVSSTASWSVADADEKR